MIRYNMVKQLLKDSMRGASSNGISVSKQKGPILKEISSSSRYVQYV